MREQLVKVKQLAADAKGRASKRRAEATSKLYEIVSGMAFDTQDELGKAEDMLSAFAEVWFA